MIGNQSKCYLQQVLDSTNAQLELLYSQREAVPPAANLEVLIGSAEQMKRDFEFLLAKGDSKVKILARIHRDDDESPVKVSFRSTGDGVTVVVLNHLNEASDLVDLVQVEKDINDENAFDALIMDELAPLIQSGKILLVDLLSSLKQK